MISRFGRPGPGAESSGLPDDAGDAGDDGAWRGLGQPGAGGRALLEVTPLVRAGLARQAGSGQGLGACSGWLKRSIMIDWPRKLGFLRTRRSMLDADSV